MRDENDEKKKRFTMCPIYFPGEKEKKVIRTMSWTNVSLIVYLLT